jgi:hypothetical protein
VQLRLLKNKWVVRFCFGAYLPLLGCGSKQWTPEYPNIYIGTPQQQETTKEYLKALYSNTTPSDVIKGRMKAVVKQGVIAIPIKHPELLMNNRLGSPGSAAEAGEEYAYSPLLGGLKGHTANVVQNITIELNTGGDAKETLETLVYLGVYYSDLKNPSSVAQGEFIIKEALKILNKYPELTYDPAIKNAIKTAIRLDDNQRIARKNEYQSLLTDLYTACTSGDKPSCLNWGIASKGLEILSTPLDITQEQREWEKLRLEAQEEKELDTLNFLNGPIINMLLAQHPDSTGTSKIKRELKDHLR